jgi:hypothetical protein
MKHMLEAFARGFAKTYLGLLVIIVYIFPAIFVCAAWALLAFIVDSLELNGLYGLGLFVIGFFGMVVFFGVYVWPRVSDVIGKVMDQLGEAIKSLG